MESFHRPTMNLFEPPSPDPRSQELFLQLKSSCVPLLGNALLTASTTALVLQHLTDLVQTLRSAQASKIDLTPSLISYAFVPVSTVLRRNPPSAIPDRVLENLFVALSLLCDSWWWECDLAIWEQIFLLASAVLGGLEGKGKARARDDETKDAALQCLLALTRDRRLANVVSSEKSVIAAEFRLAEILEKVQADKFVPVLGQTIDSLTVTTTSAHAPLQRSSLELLYLLVEIYVPDAVVPTVLPGVVSSMTKVALGQTQLSRKAWANGDTVAAALKVIESIIPRAIGDKICAQEGAIRQATSLEDLVNLATDDASKTTSTNRRSFATARTPPWLQATSSQIHIAIKTLTSLVTHPTPSAPCALCRFAEKILSTTALTLPQSQPLLLSFLLAGSNSTFESVSTAASSTFVRLLASPLDVRSSLMRTLMQSTRDNLFALPRLLPTHSDAKVEHLATQVEALCRLASSSPSSSSDPNLSSISYQFGKLLGPTGGVEKWGWGLLSVLELETPPTVITPFSAAQLSLENGSSEDAESAVSWPEVTLKNVSNRSTYAALERMLWALGRASGDRCLFAIEWFFGVGRNGRGSRSVASLWCASKLLDGVGDVSLDGNQGRHWPEPGIISKRIVKMARYLTKALAEMWDDVDGAADEERIAEAPVNADDGLLVVEFKKGLVQLDSQFDFAKSHPSKPVHSDSQCLLHKAISLRLLATSASILRSRFTPLLLQAVYPILHSLVSTTSHLSSTALTALHSVTASTGYASPGNLLLNNFDYALDSVSRRLTRRWLDVDATRVLTILVRLVGRDVVRKAGDVVEECFDRLDEYHGYEIIVEGLIEVLGEVVQAIDVEEEALEPDDDAGAYRQPRLGREEWFKNFQEWYQHRLDPPPKEEQEDYGPAPKEPWGKEKEGEVEGDAAQTTDESEPTPSPVQTLTKQIVSRSIYFLTHPSAVIRARILGLLSASTPILPPSALLPAIHRAWPFVLNRLADPEGFVQTAAAGLVESLTRAPQIGNFMSRRVWDDVWPRYKVMLERLDVADSQNALAHRKGRVGTESAYTHSHRLYRAMLRTMAGAFTGSVRINDESAWEVILAFRRFLNVAANKELQRCARDLYIAVGANNADAVWLALTATVGADKEGRPLPGMAFLREDKWDITANVGVIMAAIDNAVV